MPAWGHHRGHLELVGPTWWLKRHYTEVDAATGVRKRATLRILAFVRAHPGCTSIEISIATGIERHETSRRLADLKGNPERGRPPFICQGEPIESGGHKPCVSWWPLWTGHASIAARRRALEQDVVRFGGSVSWRDDP